MTGSHRSHLGRQRRGVILIMAVIVTTILAGLLTILATNAVQFHHQRQANRVKLVARAMSDSAVSYARVQAPAWSKAMPTAPIQLDMSHVLPPKVAGTATLQFVSQDGRRVCHISAQAAWGAYTAVHEADLPIATP